MVSLQGIAPEQVSGLKIDDTLLSLRILGRHRNRLRTGHHSGNRFRLVIRDVADHAAETVPAVLQQLRLSGVPNYFGPQRQGKDGDNHRIGAMLLHDTRRREKMQSGHPHLVSQLLPIFLVQSDTCTKDQPSRQDLRR